MPPRKTAGEEAQLHSFLTSPDAGERVDLQAPLYRREKNPKQPLGPRAFLDVF